MKPHQLVKYAALLGIGIAVGVIATLRSISIPTTHLTSTKIETQPNLNPPSQAPQDITTHPEDAFGFRPPPSYPAPISKVFGEITPYRGETDHTIFKATATSTDAKITEMQVWTDKNQSKKWQPYTQFISIPNTQIEFCVYVIYKDANANLSQTFSSSTGPQSCN